MQALVCQPAVAPQLFSAEGVVGVIFLLTVALVLTGAMIAVNSQRLVRAVAGLAICFTGLAGVYYFLLSPFLAMMQLLIYVGAVSIIIAFGIMLATPEEKSSAGSRHRSPLAGPLACSVAALMFAAMTVLAVRTEWQVFPRRNAGDIKAVGLALLTEHALVFELSPCCSCCPFSAPWCWPTEGGTDPMHVLNLYNCLSTYLIIGALLFAFGVYGLLVRRTVIGMLISAEFVLAAASTNLMAFSRFVAPDPATGQIFTLFIMAVAAAEAAIAISIMIAVYRNYKSIDNDDLVDLQG